MFCCGRIISFRPILLTFGLLFVAIGIAGVIIAARNFTFPAQAPDLMPPDMANEMDRRQPWLDFSFYYLTPFGLVGVIILPFSVRVKVKK
jgi:hypothetical protein